VQAVRLPQREWALQLPEGIQEAWCTGAHFAMQMLRENVPSVDTGRHGWSVVVTEVRGQPVDTSVEAVAYVVFQAICRATQIDLSHKFVFNAEDGSFSICGPQHMKKSVQSDPGA
jgi:hypothetical protein